MPIFKRGRGVWVKHCEVCGKTFIKTARVQKTCEKCRAGSGGAKKNIKSPTDV